MSLEGYLDEVVRGLPCSKQEKRDIHDELLDHLQSLKDEFTDQGYKEEKAEQMALESFGPSQSIAKELKRSLPLLDPYRKKWTLVGFFIYMVSMVYILFINVDRFVGRDFIIHRRAAFPEYSYVYHNLIPFRTIKNYFVYADHYTLYNWFCNLFGNILLFIPLGLMLPLLFSGCHFFSRLFAYLFAVSLCFETLQAFFDMGRFDVDDMLLNLIGGGLGFLIYRLIVRIHRKRTKAE
ncbi:VanZ family protein [Salinithrix halophila]|uniref:VanZ family protein n=1 Tax=Salinithrix halophila TaxID=1485204 RepID=A0ABV8JBM3_9BACL